MKTTEYLIKGITIVLILCNSAVWYTQGCGWSAIIFAALFYAGAGSALCGIINSKRNETK